MKIRKLKRNVLRPLFTWIFNSMSIVGLSQESKRLSHNHKQELVGNPKDYCRVTTCCINIKKPGN